MVKWYYRQHYAIKALINALAATTSFFISAVLPNELVDSLHALKTHQKALIYLGVIAITFAIYFVIFMYFKNSKEKIENQTKEENELIFLAYTKCDKIVADDMLLFNDNKKIDELILRNPLLRIQNIVSITYEIFDEYYGKGVNPNDKVKFEVTFMSKSYLDNCITIFAYKNKENRAPTSLQSRSVNKNCYENTITAMIYREQRPSIHIIEDTSDPRSGYEELYPAQQQRIQSTIVFPVFSNKNILLGTLVVHCDKKNFFKNEKLKFWQELLEIFAKRLAYEKSYLDALSVDASNHNIDLRKYNKII